MPAVYRFKIGSDLSDLLERFNIIHANDDIDDYQEAWVEFTNNNTEIINTERERHVAMGFNGDFDNKIYISTRYYRRKKMNNEHSGIKEIVSSDDKTRKQDADTDDVTVKDDVNDDVKDDDKIVKRAYNKVSADVLKTIDDFLRNGAGDLKPSVAWDNFCNDYGNELCQKKTFKNRIYQYKLKNTIRTA